MSVNIETKKFATTIHKSCDDFIKKNFDTILMQIENNRVVLDNNFSEIKINRIDKKSWGVYVFYITPKERIATYNDLKGLWETDLSGKQILYSSPAIEGRFKPLEIGQSAYLYVGKSEGDLANRIKQHIHQHTKPSTYGLKLSEHNKLHSDNTFEYSYFVIEVAPDSEIKNGMVCLLQTLEKRLSDEFTPLIGKKR